LPRGFGALDGANGERNPALAFTRSNNLVTAPAFELSSVHGERVRLTDLDSEATLLYFWSTSRECETDLQALAALKKRFADRGVTVLTLAFGSGTAEDVRRFLDTTGADVPTLMCTSRVCDDYGVAIFPTAFVLDRNHNVRYWKYGSQLADHWEQLVEEALQAGAEEVD
jgi:peroxiredoxin